MGGTLTRFLRFLTHLDWREKTLADVNGDILVAFARSGLFGDSTAYTRYLNLRLIVNEALSYNGYSYTVDVPYDRRPRPGRQKPTRALSDEELKLILGAARSDVQRYWSEFEDAHSDQASQIAAEIRAVADRNGCLLPVGKSDADFNNFEEKHRYRAGKLERMRWHRWLYATNESLLPFVILITYGLAGNIYSVLEMQRGCMQESADPIRGQRAVVRLTKHRASRELGQSFRDAGRFSVPTLIRQVLLMTEPLLVHLPPQQRNRLFIAYFPWGHQKASVRIATPPGFSQVLRGFCKRHGLRRADGTPLTFTLNMLRTTKINRAYLKSGDIFLASKIAQHKHLSTTIRYLNQMTTISRDQALIADIQRDLANDGLRSTPESASSPTRDEAAQSTERDCANPYSAPREVAGTLCKDWSYPLNDPSLVIPNEPKYVAALLRDRDALLEARLRINSERFAKLYEPKLRIIEEDILPKFDGSLVAHAQGLIPALPPARRIN